MKLGFLLGRREFSPESEIIKSVKKFERFQQGELLNTINTLLIFKSETQQCWLVFTSQRMYYVIDDIDKDIIKTLWARDKEKLIIDGQIALHLKEEDYSRESGKLYFGKMNNGILFTKSLFRNKSISGTILSLLEKHILN